MNKKLLLGLLCFFLATAFTATQSLATIERVYNVSFSLPSNLVDNGDVYTANDRFYLFYGETGNHCRFAIIDYTDGDIVHSNSAGGAVGYGCLARGLSVSGDRAVYCYLDDLGGGTPDKNYVVVKDISNEGAVSTTASWSQSVDSGGGISNCEIVASYSNYVDVALSNIGLYGGWRKIYHMYDNGTIKSDWANDTHYSQGSFYDAYRDVYAVSDDFYNISDVNNWTLLDTLTSGAVEAFNNQYYYPYYVTNEGRLVDATDYNSVVLYTLGISYMPVAFSNVAQVVGFNTTSGEFLVVDYEVPGTPVAVQTGVEINNWPGTLTNAEHYAHTTNYIFVFDENTQTLTTWDYDTSLYNYEVALRFLDEETGQLINDRTVSLQLINDAESRLYSTSNGTLTMFDVPAGESILRYSATGYAQRFYQIEMIPPTTDYQYNLTLLNLTSGANVTIHVIDTLGNDLEGYTVLIQKYNVNTNSYVTHEILDTNYAGLVHSYMVLYTEYYRFIVKDGDDTVLTSTPAYMYGDEVTLTVTLNQVIEIIEDLQDLDDAEISLTYTNATSTFAFTWTSPSSAIAQGCLELTKWDSNGVRSLNDTTCSAVNAGTINMIITDKNNTRYLATGRAHLINGLVKTDSLSVDFRTTYTNLGLFGLFITLVFTLFLVGLAGSNAEGVILAGIGGVILMGAIGFIYYNWTSIIGIIIIGVVIIYKMQKV